MPAERYYFDGELTLQANILLADTEFHHLAHVMRSKAGESVEIVNGKGALAQAEILRLDKKQAALSIRQVSTKERSSFEVILAQAIPRINRLDFILEKGTELGMTQIWLFPGETSERKILTENQWERAQAVVIAAMKQCGRLWLPQILMKPLLRDWQPLPYPSYYGDVAPDAKSFSEAWRTPSTGAIFFIGPESGFSQKEENTLLSLGSRGVKLHENILRTDTAALTALSLLSHFKGCH